MSTTTAHYVTLRSRTVAITIIAFLAAIAVAAALPLTLRSR